MINYCRQVGNTAVTKRIGFLAELYKIPSINAFIDFAKEQINEKYNLFTRREQRKENF